MANVVIPHALIVAGGNGVSRHRLNALATQSSLVVAADSGLLSLRELGIRTDIVIGDLDSLNPDDLKNIPEAQIRHDAGQDDTDLEKAIRYCLVQGVKSADIVGATGGRLDHSVNAISLLVKYDDRVSLTLHDRDGWARYFTQSPATCGERAGQKISLIPVPAVYGLKSQGLRYPLDNLDLYFGGRDAVSNEVISPPAEISWREGALLLYQQIPAT